ncbi:hypothetical protein BH20ACT10_BH20ACT10_16180 [soil metagenome]|jgi:hypothetical protein
MRGAVFCFLTEAGSIERFPETIREEDGTELPFEWLSMGRFREESRPVFPKGLLEFLEAMSPTLRVITSPPPE